MTAKETARPSPETAPSDASLDAIPASKPRHASFLPRSRVWSGSDAMRFSVPPSNYTSNLYNFAWAQAVQNKPLGFEVAVAEEVEEGEGEEEEREEGELEEGEIGDGEVENKEEEEEVEKEEGLVERKEENGEEDNIDEQVMSVLEQLEEISEDDAKKSFEETCSRLRSVLVSLKKMARRGHLMLLDAVVEQAFAAVQTIHSVFLEDEEKNKEAFSRVISYIKAQDPALFAVEQLEEISTMIQLPEPAVAKVSDGNLLSDPTPMSSGVDFKLVDDGSLPSKSPNSEPPGLPRNRADFSLLLDPHANHDEGSLPSPTRDNAAASVIPSRATSSREYVVSTEPTTSRHQSYVDSALPSYVTDALRAVSSYQQKYDRISLLSNNRLPSPTPSDEADDEIGDSQCEVSSSSFVGNTSNGFESSIGYTNGSTCPGGELQTIGSVSNESNIVPKASAKSRDPRLRMANSNAANGPGIKQPTPFGSEKPTNGVNAHIGMNSRKQKQVDAPVVGGHLFKRAKNENEVSGLRDSQYSSNRGGWLEDSSVVATQNAGTNSSVENFECKKLDSEIGSLQNQEMDMNPRAANVGNKPVQALGTVPAISLPSLLKDIAVNPTMLMHLIKEQQRQAVETQQKTVVSAQDTITSSVLFRPTGNISTAESTLKASETEGLYVGRTQLNTQKAPMNGPNEAGKLRIKPRDPRRILHSNILQKGEKMGPENSMTSGYSSSNQGRRDSTIVKQLGDQAQTSLPSSQPALPPENSQQLNKIPSSHADVKKNISLPILTSTDAVRITAKAPNVPPRSYSLVSGVSTTVSSQLPNQWGDVGHLLDGYDDRQRAAIQRERARRIDEQRKMFAARKLCLVLDLDHTLLNSAKFVEVDQCHDEILRKKEEQDREQPQRHLYRFQNMAMWTKLRPGIWNFLEKASKLFELHLYTMGNSLYATEMAKILDPTGALFAGRVISKGDDDSLDGDDRLPKSKDLEGVLGMESAVVIIDDSIRVWPHHKLNLIVVERYMYFPSSRRQFGLTGPSLLEVDRDERPEDGTLASCLAVIERIHLNFFSHATLSSIDVRNILAAEQHRILAGCRIVFSRIFPVGESNPHLHPLWQTAEQFGAVCCNQIDDQVTHVVANSLGTDKVNWALSTGRFVVHPGWVEASALLYRRADEQEFAVKI